MSTLPPTPFLLFAGAAYYAAPGWDCFRGAYLTQEDASRAVHEGRIPRRTDRDNVYPDDPECSDYYGDNIDWYQIVSPITLTVVEHGGHGYGGVERGTGQEFKGYQLPSPEDAL